MKAKTYTLLVTVVDASPPSAGDLAGVIHRAIEEGDRDFPSAAAATVDAFEGDFLGAYRTDVDVPALDRIDRAVDLHRTVRIDP